MSDEESELLTQNEALDRPLALTFLFLQDSHFKILGRFGLGGRLVAGRFGVPKVCIIFSTRRRTAANGRLPKATRSRFSNLSTFREDEEARNLPRRKQITT
jgi:hypothetical protein